MKKLSRLTFLIVLLASQHPPVAAQGNKKAEIKQIDVYAKTLNAFVEKNQSPHLVFADVSDYTEDRPEWRKYDSEAELEKLDETRQFYKVAYAWQKNGKILMTNFTLSTPSGDWAKFIFHFFREDGTLAKVESQLNTFYGDFRFVQDIYFDRRGRILRKTSKYVDLETGKPKRPRKDDVLNNEDNLKELYYKKTVDLPFGGFLKNK